MKILRRADYRRMPWKNGQGLTEEIGAFPPGSDIDSFEWRISIAHVEADGPFSSFVGVDRTIAVLDGAGLALDLPVEASGGKRTVELTTESPPFAFSGDLNIYGRNLQGATSDFNIMTRRGRRSHAVSRLRIAADERLQAGAFNFAVVEHPTVLLCNGEQIGLQYYDAVSFDGEDEIYACEDTSLLVASVY